MNLRLRPGALTIVDDVAVVFDDRSRVRWSRSHGGGWLLGEHWPNNEEVIALQRHRAAGGWTLVITDGEEITVDALPSEVPSSVVDESIDRDLIQLRLEHFDWLPDDVRSRGEEFLARERAHWSTRPALLRPPVTVDAPGDDGGVTGRGLVTFALVAPGVSRQRLERELGEYLAYVSAHRSPVLSVLAS